MAIAPFPTQSGPLAGIRVIDLTRLIAGPSATLLLGFLGAEVIKVESVRAIDPARRGVYSPSSDPDKSLTFNSMNLGKLSLRVNLQHPEGAEIIKSLVRICDALVENFRPGVLDRMGLGYAALREINPSIIVAASSAFGSVGPWVRHPGYASVFNAISGLGYVTGYRDGPPTELRDAVDWRVGATLAYALLVAMFHRQRTGEGQFVDVSAAESIQCLIGDTLLEYAMNGRNRERRGNSDPIMAPHGCYRCAGDDVWVSIAVGSDAEWLALCRAVGRAEWVEDTRFGDAYRRWANQDTLDALLESWTKERSPREVMALLQAQGVAAVPVFSGKDLFEDPHLREREAWVEVNHPKLGETQVQGPPWRFSSTPAEVRRHGPLLGEHNGYVLQELLGYSEEQVERLSKAGVLD